jgi:hypothetical protein
MGWNLMRVIVTKDSRDTSSLAYAGSLDLHEDPAAIARIDAARQYPALRHLLLNLNEDESPFSTLRCKVWTAMEDAGAEPAEFASRIDLVVSGGAGELGRAQYEDLADRLATLLEREPGDALSVELRILPAQSAGGRQGFCLRLLLFSRGTGQEQAQLRWSLGLARVQQALLFLARAIRQGRLE